MDLAEVVKVGKEKQSKFLICLFSSQYQAYLIACVWNCYRYVTGWGSSEVLLYVMTNDTTVSHC